MFFTQLQLSIMAENKRLGLRRIGTGGYGRGEREGWMVGDPERGEKREKKLGGAWLFNNNACSPKGLWGGSREKRGGVEKFPLLKYLHSLSATTPLYNVKTVEHFQPLTCKIIHPHKLKWRSPSSTPTLPLLLMRSPWKLVTFLKMTPSLSAIL